MKLQVINILNLMPRKIHNFLTPYEVLFNTSININDDKSENINILIFTVYYTLFQVFCAFDLPILKIKRWKKAEKVTEKKKNKTKGK